MRIIKLYRDSETELFGSRCCVQSYDDGDIRIEPLSMGNGNKSYFVCELSITEAKRLRDELDEHIGQLTGVQFVRTVTMR